MFAVWQAHHGGVAVSSADHTGLRRVLAEEAAAILALADRLDPAYDTLIDWILACEGRVVTCGIGKSGHIAAKTAATFASTGTPSFFLHAAEAVHGDLGMVTAGDIVMAYSYSGETDEVVRLFPSFRKIGAKTVIVTGRPESSAGRSADLVINVAVDREACPNNLAPTTSTTVMLAASDAIAVAAMERRAFTREDFAQFHPAGALGKRLLLTVGDVMRSGDDAPVVAPETPIAELLKVITQAGAGGACVVDPSGGLLGFVSDGDLRRWIVGGHSVHEGTAADLMSTGGATTSPDLLAFEALEFFQNYPRKIGEMPVLEDGRVVGLLMLKDLLRVGLV